MASVTVSASCVVYGNGTNYTVTLPLQNPNPVATPVQTLTTTSGTVSFTVPSGVVNGIWIIPPSGSSVEKNYKGNNSDFGIGGSNSNYASWAFLPITAGFVLYVLAGGVETLTLVLD